MRYFIQLQYNGSGFSGWQKQPNAPSVQATIEDRLSLLLGHPVDLTGCGRTDAGVHAAQFYAHFDAAKLDLEQVCFKLDQMVGKEIFIEDILEVSPDSHARYSAERRQYSYCISGQKSVFREGFYWHYPLFHKVDWEKVLEFARLIQEYEEFRPFCKTDSGLEHYRCSQMACDWDIDTERSRAVLTISANRFLRGMVRLIVGTGMYVSLGNLAITDIKRSMDEQIPLKKAFAAPAEGLFLSWVRYPFIQNSPVPFAASSF